MADWRALTRDEVRAIDRRTIEEFGLPGVVLMENAGRGAAQVLADRAEPGPVAICCGRGNNGGDGYVIARYLALWGWQPIVHVFADLARIAGDAAVHLAVLQKTRVPIRAWPQAVDPTALGAALAGAHWIVDGLLGTGASGPVREPFNTVIGLINASGRPVLAIDIPSGLDSDTGLPLGVAVRAAVTATFVSVKVGFANPAAAAFLGEVHVVDIGVPREVLEPFRR